MGFVKFNCGGIRCHRPQPSICFSCWRLLSLSPAAEMNVWLHLGYHNWQDVLQPPGRRDLLYLTYRIVSQSHSGMSMQLSSGGSSPWQKRGAPLSISSCRWHLCCLLEVIYVCLGACPLATQDDLAMRILWWWALWSFKI